MKPRSLDGLSGEMRDHIERETRDNIDRGMAPDEARSAAVRAFGNVTVTQEDVRAVWIPVWLEHLLQDLRYAARSVTRNPIFSLIIVVTLAIGVGLSTTVLAPFHSILLRSLDYPHAEQLVSLTITSPDLPPDADIATNQEYWAWHDGTTSIDKLVAYQTYDQTLAVASAASRVRVATVTDDFWAVTAVQPVAGRLPTPNEKDVVVLSEPLYARSFASDPRVLGRAVTLDRVQQTVIGVVPRDFRFQLPVPERPGQQPGEPDLFRSFAVTPPNQNFAQLLSIIGRLKPGTDIEKARAELTTIRVARPFSRNQSSTTIHIDPAAERLVRHARLALNVLLAAVGFVLLVACANIANLLLARATVRQREIAVRVSVGAGRTRVLRQFLFESALYSIVGGVAGLLLAGWSLAAIVRAYPQAVPRMAESAIHGPVVAVMVGVLTTITFIFGLVPALAVRRADVHGILKDGASTVSASPKRLRVRMVLAGAQLALAVALLTGAGLMLKSFWRMNERPAGFQPEHILSMRVDFPPKTTNRARRDYATRLLDRLQALPGVEAASLNTHGDSLTHVDIEGEPQQPDPPRIYENQVSADFAGVMGLRVLKGRWFVPDEPLPVVVVNETLAKLKFGRQDPIGRRLTGPDFSEPSDTTGRVARAPSEAATVVGIVADLRYSKLDEERTPELYVPYWKTPGIFRISAVMKTAGDPLVLVPSVRNVISEIDNTLTPFDIMTLDQALSDSIAPRRLNLLVLATFAATALLLALVGIYGVMSYSVSQRTHEIGIRSALGAARTDVVGMIAWQGVRIAAAGIAVGVAVALALTRVMTTLLFEVEPTDPATFIAAAALLALASLLASALPAVRAGAVDPIVALRYE